MARFTIYSKDGQIKRHEGEPQYSGSYMGVDFVEFRTISSPTPIDWQIGDYVDYYRTGKRYRLYSLPMPKKVTRKGEYGASFEYSNVQLYGATKELEIAPFRDLVPKDNKIHFSTRPDVSTYENVYGIARRIQECMDDLYPNKWRIEVYDTDDTDLLSLFEETKEYSVSGGSCLDALSQIYETWKNVGWIHTYDSANKVDVITIGRANVRNADNTSDSFAFGVGKGLTSIKKASANKDEFATRLYIYGSERNIQTRYYNGLDILNKDSVDIRNLMLPVEKWGKTNGLPDASKAYLQADDSIIEKYGLIPRTVYFDGSQNEEIYPSIVGLTERRVRQAMINAGQSSSPNLPPDRDVRLDVVASVDFTKDSGDKTAVESNPTFKLYYGHLGFNLADQGRLTSEGYAVISMKSGACAGREFVVQSSEDTGDGYGLMYQIAVVKRTWDESLGMGFPNEIYPIKNGDEFVILDIPMPDYYITLAADDLLSAGEKMLADYSRVSAFYDPSVDAIKIKEGGKLLQAGMFMQVYDEDIIDTADKKDYVLIDTLTIDEKSDLPIYRVTLREQKRSARTYSALEDMIEDARETNKQEINRVRQYTDRRFRSAQETLEMLQAAFSNFSDGISPVTIRTMSMLVGDEGLQFKFTAASSSLTDIACPFSYDEKTKQMKSVTSYLKHMTLGITTITTGAMSASSYKTWRIPAWASAVLDDGAKSYYVYVKASKANGTSECVLSETPIGMEDVSGYYHFLVGILNSEYDGKRDFITLYGFTEVLPGQITTDVLRSANSNLIIDLLNAKISAKNGATIEGKVTFQSGSSGLENLSEWSGKQQQIDNAQSTANTASQSAQKAQGDATQAKQDATTAHGVALNAQSVANQAIQDASDARDIATTAKASVVTLGTRIDGVDKTIAEINNKLDGVVEDYYDDYVPSRDNLPASEWIANGTEEDHIGDTFTNTALNGEDAGRSWRWLEQADGTYDWQLITDSDAAKALALAGQAKAAADGKTKTFLITPTNYNIGDLWIVGDTVPEGFAFKKGDILTTDFASVEYTASHWRKFINYNDEFQSTLDAKVGELNDAIDNVEQNANDYTDEVKTALQTSINALNEAKANINAVYTIAQADGKISEAEQRAIDAADDYAKVAQANAEANVRIWADGEIKDAEQSAINTANANLEAAKIELNKSIASLDTKTGQAIKAADDAQDAAESAQNEASSATSVSNAAKALAEAAEALSKQADSNASKAVNSASDAQTKASAAQGIAQEAEETAEAANNLANTAKTNAENAVREAGEAKQEAESATSKLNSWADDKVISPFEKQGVKDEYAFVVADKADIVTKAVKYNVSDDSFITAYNPYEADLLTILNATGESVNIPSDMSAHQSAYYSQRTAILDAIATAAKKVATDAQNAADEAGTAAQNAQTKAESAQAAATGAQKTADEAKELASAVEAANKALDTKISNIETGVSESVAEINARLDGVVENYYEEGAPALDKKPVTDWKTDLDKINHVGDTYTNIQEYVNDTTTPDAGKSWRWCWCEDSSITDKIEVTDKDGNKRYLHWHPIADSDAVKALLEASKAQAAADGKSKNFVNQPVPPYSVGDLWIQGPDGDTMRCIKTRETGSFDASDWEKASKYTDDTIANNALSKANEAIGAIEDVNRTIDGLKGEIESSIMDGVIDETEKKSIEQYLKTIDTEKAEVNSSFNSVYSNVLLPSTQKNNLYNAYSNVLSRINVLVQAINNFVGGNGTISTVNDAFNAYKSTYTLYVTSLEGARKAIEDVINNKADDAKASAETAKSVADAAKSITDSLNNDGVLTEVEKREIRRQIYEITECKGDSVKTHNAQITRDVVSGNPWYLVGKDSYVEYYEDEDGETIKVSQKQWEGYYSSNMHEHDDSTTTRLNISVIAPFDLKLRFGSDAESDYDYLIVGALDKDIVLSDTISDLTSSAKQANTKGKQGIGNVQTKTFACGAGSRKVELAYKKDDSQFSGSDSGYYRLLNESWVDAGTEYIMELKGSFHRYFLTLMKNGLQDEANELKRLLDAVMRYLNTYGLWTTGDTDVPNTSTEKFRDKLNSLLIDYYSYATEIGFNTSINRLNDLQYLSDAMKNGQSVIDGGLVLSSMVAVGDTENLSSTDIEAFLNGSDFAQDTEEHGKLILAAGIPENGGDLEQRSKEASTRIYEDGCTFTKKMHLEDGCTIGENIIVTDVGIKIENHTSHGGTTFLGGDGFTYDGLIETTYPSGIPKREGTNVNVGGCGNVGIRIGVGENGHEATAYCPSKGGEIGILVGNDSNKDAIRCESGLFAGLRPKTRVITTSTPVVDRTLTELDHTIIINIKSGSVTIKTPPAPQDGQVYEIYTCHHTMDLTIDFNGKDAYSFIEATNKPSDTFTADYRRHITLIYAGGQWWEDYRFLY